MCDWTNHWCDEIWLFHNKQTQKKERKKERTLLRSGTGSYGHMSAYGLLGGCAQALLSMWVNAYIFSAIYNEHWAPISFSDICVPTCHCFWRLYSHLSPSPYPPLLPSDTTSSFTGHDHWGGDPHSQSWARGGETYDQSLICFLLSHYLPHAPPKTRPQAHNTPLLEPHFPPTFLPPKPSNTSFFRKYSGPKL